MDELCFRLLLILLICPFFRRTRPYKTLPSSPTTEFAYPLVVFILRTPVRPFAYITVRRFFMVSGTILIMFVIFYISYRPYNGFAIRPIPLLRRLFSRMIVRFRLISNSKWPRINISTPTHTLSVFCWLSSPFLTILVMVLRSKKFSLTPRLSVSMFRPESKILLSFSPTFRFAFITYIQAVTMVISRRPYISFLVMVMEPFGRKPRKPSATPRDQKLTRTFLCLLVSPSVVFPTPYVAFLPLV